MSESTLMRKREREKERKKMRLIELKVICIPLNQPDYHWSQTLNAIWCEYLRNYTLVVLDCDTSAYFVNVHDHNDENGLRTKLKYNFFFFSNPEQN